MNKRLALFIEYKTGGNQKDFAAMLGWSPQYLHKMLKGDSMGIQPVITLLQTFPELNARWLILGEGAMLDIRRNIMNMLELEKYIPVMSREEIRKLSEGRTNFDDETIERWKVLLSRRESETRQRFEAAYKRQESSKNSEKLVNNS